MSGRKSKKDVFGKKLSRQEWQQASLKRNQMAILHKKTPFIIREAYKTARTNIIFALSGSKDDGCKIITFTSSNAGEGKTTTALNIAITFSQTGARVLVIDGDMRKPRLHQYLGIIKTNGLSTVLAKQKTFEEVVYRDIRDGLDCLTSGSIPPNPAELLQSDAMQELLEKLKHKYDYIFIDTPPITVVTDAAAVSKFVSGVLMVVREGVSNHEDLEHALNLLKMGKTKLLGFFVNDIDPSNANYGAYNKSYGKRYGYKYGGYKYGSDNHGYRSYHYNYTYGNNYSYQDTPMPKYEEPAPVDENILSNEDLHLEDMPSVENVNEERE